MTAPGRRDDPANLERVEPTPEDGAGTTRRLHVAVRASIDLRRVPAVFGEHASSWLGEALPPDATGLTRYLCDLELRVSPERHSLFRKAAIVGLGTPQPLAAGWTIPIEWRAATLAPLFPVLAGRLTVTAGGIGLDGHYAPPFGIVGQMLDRGLLSIAAQGTARWFLAKVVVALAED